MLDDELTAVDDDLTLDDDVELEAADVEVDVEATVEEVPTVDCEVEDEVPGIV